MIPARELAIVLTLSLLACLAWRDLATRIIPNWICATLAACGLLVRTWHGFEALAVSVGLAALVLLAFLPIHPKGMLGGGDIKLLAACPPGAHTSSWRLPPSPVAFLCCCISRWRLPKMRGPTLLSVRIFLAPPSGIQWH